VSPDYNGYESRVSGTEQQSGRRLLAIAFAVFFLLATLKISHTVDWSWWLVTAPLSIPFALALVITLWKGTDK
jgi:hypothetical protein